MTQGAGKIFVDTPPCDSRRHLDEPRVPAVRPGYRICAVCLDDVENALVDLPELYERCEELLAPTPHGLGQRVRRTRTHGIELREDVAGVRSRVVDTLASWCATVVAARGVRVPERPVATQLARFLLVHLQWLVTGPEAAEFADDLSGLAAVVASVLRSAPPPPVSLGPCPWPGCGQELHALRDEVTGAPARQIGCAAGHRWPPEEWLALTMRISDDDQGPAGGART